MRYEISVSGRWGARSDDLLAGMEVRTIGDTRVLSADLDQAALNGLLERIRVLGLELIEVRRVRPPGRARKDRS
jgi:hypothetical protein